MKLGMNMLLWGSHVTKDHFPIFEKIKAAGFDGVELPIFEGDPAHYAIIGKELQRQGLKSTVVTCLGVDANPISADPAIRKAGLDRVNISADSLRAERVVRIARRDLGFDLVTAAKAAEDAGIGPIKINVVVMRGINDDEVADFARLTLEHPWHVRFIELMPVGELRELTWDHVVPSAEVLAQVQRVGVLQPDSGPSRGNGPAVYHRFAGAPGTIGVITPMTHTYCSTCNRVRLTADGRLRTCLFGDHEVPLRDALRRGEPLEPLFVKALAEKPKEHDLLQMRVGGLRALSEVGG